MIDISVIIPNYNNQKYIEQCILSVVEQSFPPKEIIIVDDCSSDNSKEIITRLSHIYDNVIPVFLEKNGGVSHARNEGLKLATSQYVTTLDADDFYFNKDKLKNEIERIQSLMSRYGSDIVSYSIIQRVDESGTPIQQKRLPGFEYWEGNIFPYLISGWAFRSMPRDYCFPRSLIENGLRYNENSCLYEDLEFLYEVSMKCRFFFSNAYGTAYRVKETGLSHRPENVKKDTIKQIKKEYLSRVGVLTRFRISIMSVIMNTLFCVKKIIKTR